MSIFLSRIRRLLVAGAVLAAVVGVLESGAVSYVLVASKNNVSASTAQCTLTGSTVGGPLTLTGSGYAPNTDYAAEFQWPSGGAGTLPANSDSSGAISVSTYAYWSGTYHVSVYTTGHHTQLMASCSTTVS